MTEPIVIEVFSDYICPWCYLSTPLVERLQAEEDVEIRWSHYPLHPNIPVNGRALKDMYKGDRATHARAFQSQMQKLMEEAGLPYGKRSMIWNSRLAQEFAAWAATQPGGSKLHGALFKAYFVDNDNIGDIDVLVGIAEQLGLDAQAARESLETRTFSDAVDADWAKARELGLTGVPSFTHGDVWVQGCQPIEVLLRFVTRLRERRDGLR